MKEIMTEDELLQSALHAQRLAYAPYSNFRVGAALVAGGKLFEGANVENASYGLSVCAERSAIIAAVLDGQRSLAAIAVATESSPPAAPCGMCLQTLIEFSPSPDQVRVVLGNASGEQRSYSLADLLPHGFVPADLKRLR